MTAFKLTFTAFCRNSLCLLFVVSLSLIEVPALADDNREQVTFTLKLESPLLASKGKAAYSVAEARAELDAIPTPQREAFLRDPDRFTKFLSNKLIVKALYADAIENNFLDNEKVGAELLNQIASATARRWQNAYAASKLLSDYTARAKELYLRDPERFRRPASVTFGQIAIRKVKLVKEVVTERVSDLVAKVKAGANIQKLAVKWSDDPNVARTTGLFRDLSVTEIPEEIRSQLQELETGAVASVQAEDHIFIIQKFEFKESVIPPFEKLKDNLIREARAAHKQEIINDYIEDIAGQPLDIPNGAVREFLDEYNVQWNAAE